MKQEGFFKKVVVGVTVGLLTVGIVAGFTALGTKIDDWKDKVDDDSSKIESVEDSLGEEETESDEVSAD